MLDALGELTEFTDALIAFCETHSFYCFLLGGMFIAGAVQRYVNHGTGMSHGTMALHSAVCALMVAVISYTVREVWDDFHEAFIPAIGAAVGFIGLSGIRELMGSWLESRGIVISRKAEPQPTADSSSQTAADPAPSRDKES